MLNAARAQGRPMMVIAMMIAAAIQAAAIHTPPSNSQRMFRNIDTGCMTPLSRSVLIAKDSKEAGAIERSSRNYSTTVESDTANSWRQLRPLSGDIGKDARSFAGFPAPTG